MMSLHNAARNVLANSDYCPHCLNAGGSGSVGSNGAVFPEGKHGICGDPWTDAVPRKHEAYGKYWTGQSAAVYEQGQIITLNVRLTAYHKGFFEFRICKINGASAQDEAQQLTEDCFDQHWLKQANIPEAQNPGESKYYIGPESNGNWDYVMYYQLPAGLNCDGESSRCVLQWHYLTGNSCNPPGIPAKYASPVLSTCGIQSGYPEEFWNCADITIYERSTPVPSSPSPVPTPPSSPPSIPSSPSPQPVPPPLPVVNPPAEYPESSAPYMCQQIINQGFPYGFYADIEGGCVGFYRCESAGSWYFECPNGLLFNQQAGACDWPYNGPGTPSKSFVSF